jgi:hypothetical protein
MNKIGKRSEIDKLQILKDNQYFLLKKLAFDELNPNLA